MTPMQKLERNIMASSQPKKEDTGLSPRATLGLLTRPEAAEVLGQTADTLKKWGVLRKGPASIKVGLRRYYKLTSIQKWVDSQESEQGA